MAVENPLVVLPPIPDVEISDPGTRLVVDNLRETIGALMGTRGDPNLRALTLGEATSGIAVSSPASTGGGLTTAQVTTIVDAQIAGAAIPSGAVPTLTNLVVTPTFQGAILTWGTPTNPSTNVKQTQIWRNTTDNLATAVLHGTTTSQFTFFDPLTAGDNTVYYWVRAVSYQDTFGGYNAVTGTSGNIALVGTTDLSDLVLTADKLAAEAVIDGKIAADAVGTDQIKNLAVGNAAIANAAITNAKIADLAVDNAKIVDATILSAKIADGQITNAKIGEYIQSNNYNGTSGWKIDKTGTAEFGAITIRDSLGNVLLTSGGTLGASIDNAQAILTAKSYTESWSANGATVGATIGTNLLGAFDQSAWNVVMPNALIGAAHIVDASVGTLELAGQAVNLPYSDYAEALVASGSGWQNAATVTVPSEGLPAYIHATIVLVVPAFGNPKVRLYDETTATELYLADALTPSETHIVSMSRSVVLSATTHVIRLQVDRFTGSYFKKASLLYLEVKR